MLEKYKKVFRFLRDLIKLIWSYVFNFTRIDKCCDEFTMRCLDDPKNKNYNYHLFGKNTPECCKRHLFIIINEVIKILYENDVPYIGTYGTHLGAIRHSGLIPWDTDIDIAILNKYKLQAKACLSLNLPPKFRIEESTELIRVYFGDLNSLHVDIEFWEMKDGKCFWSDDAYVGYREVEEKYFLETKKVTFGPVVIFCPEDDNILTEIYGSSWKKLGVKKWALINKLVKIDT